MTSPERRAPTFDASDDRFDALDAIVSLRSISRLALAALRQLADHQTFELSLQPISAKLRHDVLTYATFGSSDYSNPHRIEVSIALSGRRLACAFWRQSVPWQSWSAFAVQSSSSAASTASPVPLRIRRSSPGR